MTDYTADQIGAFKEQLKVIDTLTCKKKGELNKETDNCNEILNAFYKTTQETLISNACCYTM